MFDSIAQLVEHYTFNVRVLGSNPSGITKDHSSRVVSMFLDPVVAKVVAGELTKTSIWLYFNKEENNNGFIVSVMILLPNLPK